MTYRLVIHRSLPGLNEYIAAERSNRHVAAKMKKQIEHEIIMEAKIQLKKKKFDKPVSMIYCWYEKDKRRDKDNISFARKFIQDSLVKNGNLKNDGWKEIDSFSDEFRVDKENPRVEVLIMEVEK